MTKTRVSNFWLIFDSQKNNISHLWKRNIIIFKKTAIFKGHVFLDPRPVFTAGPVEPGWWQVELAPGDFQQQDVLRSNVEMDLHFAPKKTAAIEGFLKPIGSMYGIFTYIYHTNPKCRWIYHTWILWVKNHPLETHGLFSNWLEPVALASAALDFSKKTAEIRAVFSPGKQYGSIWVFPKMVGFFPQIIHFNRVFHYFHHPFWGHMEILLIMG